jgi:aspartate/methionine/tyrosine aminotransferase
VRIREFGVERWMDRYETTCLYNLAETCVESLTVAELLAITGKTDTILDELLPLKLTYGAFSLAGLRLGWIVGPVDLLHAVTNHRDYNTISVGLIDDYFAAIALEHRDAILSRSRRIVRENLDLLDRWVGVEPGISYIKPRSGTTALLRYRWGMTSVEFCTRLIESTGVMFTPGSALDMEGYVRIGYANSKSVLEAGLERVSGFAAGLDG